MYHIFSSNAVGFSIKRGSTPIRSQNSVSVMAFRDPMHKLTRLKELNEGMWFFRNPKLTTAIPVCGLQDDFTVIKIV